MSQFLVRSVEEELEGVFVVGDEDGEGVAFPLPLLVALDALVSVFASRAVVRVEVARDGSCDGAAALLVGSLAKVSGAGVVLCGW